MSALVPVLPGLVTKGCRTILSGMVAPGSIMVVWGNTLNLWGVVVLTFTSRGIFTKLFTYTMALVSLVECPSNTTFMGG